MPMNIVIPITPRTGAPPERQRGMALIMALVILMILTILGITAMTTSALEEKMSGNIQEQTRAFQAAESGVSEAIRRIVTGADTTLPFSPNPYQSGRSNARVMVTAQGTSKEVCSASNTADCSGVETSVFRHYSIRSRGTTTTNARTLVDQGIKISAPELNAGGG